jgi:hypothetical protein
MKARTDLARTRLFFGAAVHGTCCVSIWHSTVRPFVAVWLSGCLFSQLTVKKVACAHTYAQNVCARVHARACACLRVHLCLYV